MIKRYFLSKIGQKVITEVSKGDMRGLWAYVKKATLGLVLGIAILFATFIVVLVLFVQFLMSVYLNSINNESVDVAKNIVVTEVMNSTQGFGVENIKNTLIQNVETVTPFTLLVVEGQEALGIIEAYIQKLRSLLP